MQLSDIYNPASDSKPAPYDKVIIGGGPVGLFAAYEILRAAQETNRPVKLAVVAEQFHSPSFAGSQIFHGTDGSYVHGNTPELDALLRKGQRNLYDTIEHEKIECREHKGLEVKAPTHQDIEDFKKDLLNKNIFKPDEMRTNTAEQKMVFHDCPHSVIFEGVGQINVPDLQAALVKRIQDMGGHVFEGARYEGQSRDATSGIRTLHTDQGTIETTQKPLLVTGARHLLAQDELKNAGTTVWTMSVVLGPLSPEDQRKVSNGPAAFALLGGGSEIEADFPWGGLDEKGHLTFGMGDTEDPSKAKEIEASIMASIAKYFPEIAEKYGRNRNVSFGAMLVTPNNQPIVGRFQDYDVMGGWGGRGITPGYAAATAYADHFVRKNDQKLKIFEKLQPDLPFRAQGVNLHSVPESRA